jgi:hypothetical protein
MPDAPPVTNATPRPAMFQTLVSLGCNRDTTTPVQVYLSARYFFVAVDFQSNVEEWNFCLSSLVLQAEIALSTQ